MGGTLWNRMWRRPVVAEALAPERAREMNGIRALVIGAALGVDALLYVALRDEPQVRRAALDAFVLVNVPLLTLDLVLALVMRRRGTAPAVLLPSVAIDMTTTMVFIQATGSVSSYFLLVPPFFVFLYRFMMGYAAGVTAVAMAVICHTAVVGLELAGLLPPAALFTASPGPMYSSAALQACAYVSIQTVFVVAFGCSNYFSRTLREKDEALREAQGDLERALDEGRPGRLTGVTLGGAYRLLEVLGRGGMGEVYRAERVADKASVAVKVLHGHLAENPTAIARFKREIDAVKTLPTTATAHVLASGKHDDGSHYLVMELLEGEDLAALLRRRSRLPLSEVVGLVRQLASILDGAHDSGIVHRDVKPQNVFLLGRDGDDRALRLLDFGIARLVGDEELPRLTETAVLVGTPGYLAPEQVARDFGELGPATDVFALGAVAYRALTGRPAFASRHPAAAVYEAIHVVPTAPSALVRELPSALDAVFTLALAKRPTDRYQRAGELARDLAAAADGQVGADTLARARRASASAPPPAADHTLTNP